MERYGKWHGSLRSRSSPKVLWEEGNMEKFWEIRCSSPHDMLLTAYRVYPVRWATFFQVNRVEHQKLNQTKPYTYYSVSRDTLEGGRQSVGRVLIFFPVLMKHREVGHQSVGKIFLLWKTIKRPKNYSSKKKSYHRLPPEVRKAANCSKKVISDRNTLLNISNKISYVVSQNKLLFYHVI